MGQHRAFGTACRARCVEDGGEIVRCSWIVGKIRRLTACDMHERAAAVVIERLNQCSIFRCHGLDAIGCLRRCHDETRFGVTDEVVKFSEGVGGVQRQIDRTAADAGEIEHQGFGAFFHLNGHPVAGHNAQVAEGARKLAGAAQHVAIGPCAAVACFNEHRVAGWNGMPDGVKQVVAHELSSSSFAVFLPRRKRL